MKARKFSYLVAVTLILSTFVGASQANANDSPNWILYKSNSFTLQTPSDLTQRGTVVVTGSVPVLSSDFATAIFNQQTSGGRGTGICTWTAKDSSYPGYVGQGGLGILITGPSLDSSSINQGSFKIQVDRYQGFNPAIGNLSSPTNDQAYITSIYGSEGAINLNGSDLLFASTALDSGSSFYGLKDFSATFSTDNWPGGNYQIIGVYHDGCTGAYASSPINFTLSSIPTPNWACTTNSAIKASDVAVINCHTDTPVSFLPYHLEIFQDGNWTDLVHGTATGTNIKISGIRLPVGSVSLRFHTDELSNQYHEAISNEMSVSVSPAPYSVKCSSPTAVRAQESFDISCLSTADVEGAIAHLQYLANGQWKNNQDGTWTGTNLVFGNLYFSSTGSATMRVTTDAESGMYLGATSPSFTIKVNAAAKTQSGTPGGSSSGGATRPTGKVDKTSNAYKTMFTVGGNFAKISLASDTAQSQCNSARTTGSIMAEGRREYLGMQAQMIQSYLNTASGYQGCLDGFGH